jgi:hypothetical protein
MKTFGDVKIIIHFELAKLKKDAVIISFILYQECRIFDSHRSGYEEYYLLGYNAM